MEQQSQVRAIAESEVDGYRNVGVSSQLGFQLLAMLLKCTGKC